MILSRFPCPATLRLPARLSLTLTAMLLAASAGANPGDPDPGFGGDGIVYVDSGSSNDVFYAVHPAGDGAAYAAGALSMEVDNSADFAVVRLLRNGNPDPAFGNGGIAWIDTTGDADVARAIALQTDGKLLLAGSLENGAYSDFGLARFLPNGQPDTSFGEDAGTGLRRGYVRLNIGPTGAINDSATAVAVQSNQRIVVAGQGYAQDGGFTYARYSLARFLADGSLDTGFGTNGIVVTPPLAAQTGEFVTAIARLRDGRLPANDRITVVGYVFGRNSAIVRRYLPNGAPDTSFGANGVVELSYAAAGGGSGLSRIDDAVLQDDGKLVLLGTDGQRGFTFMRLNANGSVDASFGSGGRRLVRFSEVSTNYDEPSAIALQPNGKIVAAGYATSRTGSPAHENFAVVRLLANGAPDSGFGDGNGRYSHALSTVRDEAFAVTVLHDGAILAAGDARRPTGVPGVAPSDAALLRLFGDSEIFADGFED